MLCVLAPRGKVSIIDSLAYTYATPNQLSKVADGSSMTAGFNDGANVTTEYTYDTHGNLTADQNKAIDSIKYNVLGKASRIKFHDGRVIVYTYDAAGTKLKMATTIGGTTTTTDYVNGFVYTNSTLSFFSSPEGRVVKNGSAYEYQYAIADHQGNTRVLFTSATSSPVATIATFEGNSGDNSSQFTSVSNIVTSVAANHTGSGSKVIRMNQSYPVGPSKSTKVYPGDKVDLEVWAYYENTTGYGTTNKNTAGMITGIASAFGGASGGSGESGSIYNGVNSAIGGFGLGSNVGDSRPSAYINYILFDKNYKLMDMPANRSVSRRLGMDGGPKQRQL